MADRESDERRTRHPPETDDRFSAPLRGVDVDDETRCAHYDDAVDVVAIRFACCDCYYPCFRCHEELTDHGPARIPAESFGEPAVLCGACGTTLATQSYLDCDDECPICGAAFNPGCRRHRDRYFAVDR